MRLLVDLPSDWISRDLGGNTRLVAIPGGDPQSRAVLELTPILPMPEDRRAWAQRTLLAQSPPESTLAIGRTESRETELGWHMGIVEAKLLLAGVCVEARMAAFYEFLDYAACALVRAASPERLAMERPVIERVLLTGRPDWRGELAVCIADLLALDSAQ